MTKIAGTGDGARSGSISRGPDPLVRDTDPQIRICIKSSRIRNNAGFVTSLSQAERLKVRGMMVLPLRGSRVGIQLPAVDPAPLPALKGTVA
jgi:hypothetical protein